VLLYIYLEAWRAAIDLFCIFCGRCIYKIYPHVLCSDCLVYFFTPHDSLCTILGILNSLMDSGNQISRKKLSFEDMCYKHDKVLSRESDVAEFSVNPLRLKIGLKLEWNDVTSAN
jgi:hypothetical protein